MRQLVTNGGLGTDNQWLFRYRAHTPQGRAALMRQVERMARLTAWYRRHWYGEPGPGPYRVAITVEHYGESVFGRPLRVETFRFAVAPSVVAGSWGEAQGGNG